MRIVDIRERTFSIASDIRNAYIDFSKMTCSLVAVVTDIERDGRPVVGYGFNSNGRYGQGGLIRERFVPRLLEAEADVLIDPDTGVLCPFRAWDRMMINEKPGGHGERSVAVGTIDMALWDAVAKIEGVPLYRLLADRFRGGAVDDRVWVYAAGGYYYPGKGHDALVDEMKSYLDLGYTTVKIKIGGETLEEDLRRIDALSAIIDPTHLCVDANGRFDEKTALAYAAALDPYGLYWYEEAGDPLDYALQARLSEAYGGAMATGENLFSVQDQRNLIRYGGMHPETDFLQFDCALSYGLVEFMRMLEMLGEYGWSSRRVVPHGGHQMSLNIAAGLGLGGNESYPGVFQPFGGFADDADVVDSYVSLSDAPGIGFENKSNLFPSCRALVDDLPRKTVSVPLTADGAAAAKIAP